jgi:anti-sigma regulatory factor (Ser/Thr protein kinase)
MARPQNQAVRDFILRNLEGHEGDIASFAAKELGVTRATTNGYLRKLVEEGLLTAAGETKARQYRPKLLDDILRAFDLKDKPQEDVLWRDEFYSHFVSLPENILRICEYGFGEIVNNAIDHSEGQHVLVQVQRDYGKVVLTIMDDGVGIFDKIARECRLTDKHEAILELSKGKLTTDRSKHTGEGIFFTSRMFDGLAIISGGLGYIRRRTTTGEYLFDIAQRNPGQRGTAVRMEIRLSSPQTIKGVFDQYLGDEYRFTKTTIPLKLAQYEGEHLVSRSQARRIMMRAEKFKEVSLDFTDVTEIGQQFADEIFRVWATAHPQVVLYYTDAAQEVRVMILHALANASEDAQLSLNLENGAQKPS